jgi:hypothetical protein
MNAPPTARHAPHERGHGTRSAVPWLFSRRYSAMLNCRLFGRNAGEHTASGKEIGRYHVVQALRSFRRSFLLHADIYD